MRLIDADALAKAFRDLAESVAYIQKDRTYWSESLISAAEEVDDTPTIDAVPVVRCKDCKHFKTMNLFGNVEFCDRTGEEIERWLMVGAEDFCSRGERKSK